jgi:hypothetical protein
VRKRNRNMLHVNMKGRDKIEMLLWAVTVGKTKNRNEAQRRQVNFVVMNYRTYTVELQISVDLYNGQPIVRGLSALAYR